MRLLGYEDDVHDSYSSGGIYSSIPITNITGETVEISEFLTSDFTIKFGIIITREWDHNYQTDGLVLQQIK